MLASFSSSGAHHPVYSRPKARKARAIGRLNNIPILQEGKILEDPRVALR